MSSAMIMTSKGGNIDALQLKTADVAQVVLGFNYEAHNAPATNSQQFRSLCGTITHPCTKFQRNQTIRGEVIAI